jgi:hypothetical protein
MSSSVRFYPDIDYRAHPAFRDLGVSPRTDDDVVDGMIADIDRELGRLHETRFENGVSLRQAFVEGPERKISALESYLDETIPNDRARRLLKRAFAHVRDEFLDQARIKNDSHTFDRTLSSDASRVAADLRRDGAHICRLPRDDKKKIWNLCSPVIARLRAAAERDPKGRVAESLPLHSDIGVQLGRFFRRHAVLDGLSAYIGSNVTFTGFALEFSHSRQNWWQDCYSDVGLPISKTVYMHYDQGCRNPKAIIALSDVAEENGPTGHISGSHQRPRSNFVHFMIKSIDHRCHDDYVAGAQLYFRPRYQELDYRREFLLLPAALQACSHFGEDILDGSDLSAELLNNEVKLTHDVGDCIVFDGDYGIHRGALLRSGERFVFQVIFAVQPDPPKRQVIYDRSRAIARQILKGA